MKFALVSIMSMAIALIAHKIIANPDLYFLIGGIDGIIVTLILRDDL